MARRRPERFDGERYTRGIVLLGSFFCVIASPFVTLIVILIAPALTGGRELSAPVLLAVGVFMAITVLAVALANLLAARGTTVHGVFNAGCGTLLVGMMLAIAALLLLISAGF